MSLNWSTAVFIGIISLGPITSAFLVLLVRYFKEKYKHDLYMAMGWFSILMWCVFWIFANLLLSEIIFIFCIYAVIPAAFLITFLVDHINRESVDPFKIFMVTAVSAVAIFATLEPNNVIKRMYPNGEQGLTYTGSILIGGSILFLLAGGMYIYYMAKIYYQAPKNLKSISSLSLLGSILVGFLSSVTTISSLIWIIPGLHMLVTTTGALLTAIAFTYEPRLAFILPFKVLRLTAIETKSGISIFSHIWNKLDTIDEHLLSGVLQSISLILNQALKKGNIREIQLEQATLILRRSEKFSVICVLITTKSSRSLRLALNSFARKFFTKFSQYFSNPHILNNFEAASDLIAEIFTFIPEYS